MPRYANEIEHCGRLIKMFKRELRIFYSINHIHIVKIYGGIERNVSGLPSYRKVSELLRFSILVGVIDGLSYLHSVKTIHQETKTQEYHGTP